MTDHELNVRLQALAGSSADTHEILRGVTDALAVIGECAERASTDDVETLDAPDVWREEAEMARQQSEKLLRKAASLLLDATNTIEESAEQLGEEDLIRSDDPPPA